MSSNAGKRSIKDILIDMRARGGDFANFANELFEAVNREFAEFANELKSEFSFLLRNNVKEAEETSSEEDVWACRAKEDAELSNDQDEDSRLAVEAEKKETEDEKEPPEVAGYISSRPVDKLQFNIDTVKLGNLPGCYKMVKEEGGFFKALSDSWNSGKWFENEQSMEEDDTPCSYLDGLHCCSDTFWVNPKYANSKMSDLGEIGCREVAMDGTTAISIVVYYKKDDGTVIAYDLNAC